MTLRVSEREQEAWGKAAEAAGQNLSEWLREAGNQYAELQQALGAQDRQEKERTILPVPVKVEQIRDKMYPQSKRKCVHRLQPGTYCKSCGVTK